MCMRDEPCKTNIYLNSKTCIEIVNNTTMCSCGIDNYIHKAGGV